MSFLYPYALFALIAVPILIIIYILRNKYKEETDSSTYLWELSEKFLKKRNPLHKLEHLLALLTQIFTIVFLSLCVAHPVFTIPDAANNIAFILDGSASMNIVHADNLTRFDAAKNQIKKVAEEAADGSTFTLIYVGDEERTVCTQVDDLSRFEMYLDTLTCSVAHAEIDDAVEKVQQFYSSGTCNECYIATDRVFTKDSEGKYQVENLNIIDVSDDAINYSVHDVTAKLSTELVDGVSTNVVSVDAQFDCSFIEKEGSTKKSIKYELFIDGISYGTDYLTDLGANTVTTKNIIVSVNDTKTSISKVQVKILSNDALDIDNSAYYYPNTENKNTNILVVSESSTQAYFLKAVFSAIPNCTYNYSSLSAYRPSNAYDITIFDGVSPSELPAHGAVWFFGIDKDVPDSGFTCSDLIDREDQGGLTLSYTENTESTLYNQITKNTAKSEILVSKYHIYDFANDTDFTTVINYYNDQSGLYSPMVFVGKVCNDTVKEVVFSFDLHDSNLVVKYDFVVLMKNLVEYSNPTFLSQFSYTTGDSALFSLNDDITDITITTPSDKKVYVALTGDYIDYTMDEVGTYVVKVTKNDSEEDVDTYKLFVQYPTEEENTSAAANQNYVLAKNENTKPGNGVFDNILWIIIVASVLFAADWALYSHEQY